MQLQDNGQRNQIAVPLEVEGNLNITIQGNDNIVRFGARAKFPNMRIDIRANRCVIDIGDDCVLTGEIHCRDHKTSLYIGAKTTAMLMKITMHESGTIRIGQDCMLSGQVRMDTSDMHSVLDVTTGERVNPPADVEIGDHVWLGYGVYVMKGVRVGANCVVGANAVVTHDLPPGSLAVGIPAKVVRSGITWDRRRLPLKNPPPKI